MVHHSVVLFRQRWKGLMRPMKLKSSVRCSRKDPGRSPCMQEMAALMSCWKNSEFSDLSCSEEIRQFVHCSRLAGKTTSADQFGDMIDGTGFGDARTGKKAFTVEEVNRHLKRFAWAQ